MPLSVQEFQDILSAFNQTGGIPLNIQSTAAVEPTQFWAMFILSVISSAFIIIWLGSIYLKPIVMQAYVRFALYKFKKVTGRNYIIIKHTQQALFSSSMIDSDTLHSVETAIQSFKGKPFDIILHTPGGVIFYTQLLAKIIKESSTPVRCFVPYYAMSGGTMLALSCSEIFMGSLACLGPVDPQLGSLFGYGSARSWREVVLRKGRRAGDAAIQYAFMGDQYTKTLKENLRYALTGKIADPEQMEAALDYLTSGTIEHGYQISPLKLAEFGIHVNMIDPEIQKLITCAIVNPWIEGVTWG